MSIRSFQDFHDLNEADTWTVYYKKGSFGREVVKSGLSKQAATRLYNKLSADIPSEYDGVEMVMEAASDVQIRKMMKLAKNRPAPFAVVAVKGGKVVAQDIDIKTWELVLAHYREMVKAHPDAKIHVEDAEGQSVMESIVNEIELVHVYKDGKLFGTGELVKDKDKIIKGKKHQLVRFDGHTEDYYPAKDIKVVESVDILPSYEVLIGLATVMGALDLAQAARGGDSIIVDVAKALKAELGDKLEAAGAEAKRVVSKFKNDPKIKEIIMDAEEEVNESKRSTAMKISLFEEYFNEAKSDIAPGSRVEVTGKSIGNMSKTLQGKVTRKNSNGTYEVSLDNGDMADYKADELKLIESVNEARPNFNQLAYISSAEYQKVKKLKNFNAADWKWDSKKDLYKNVRIAESVNEARTIIKTKGKRLAIDKEDLERLKSGKDIVGYSTKYPGQEEWILARDKWEIEESVNEGVRSPNDYEYDLAVKFAKSLKPAGKLQSIGIDNKTGDINIEVNGEDYILNKNGKIKESVNEATETGLMVVPRTNADANKIKQWVDKSGMYGEWNAREGYFLFPEEEEGFDELEMELTKELDGLGVNYHIEGIFESKKSNQMSIKKFESYFGDDQLNEAASGDLIKKMDKALEDFEETLGDLEFYWGQLSIATNKIGKAMVEGDDSKEMSQAWYRANMAQRNAAKKVMRMRK